MDFLVTTVLLGTSRASLGLLLALPKWKDFLNSGFLEALPASSLPPPPPPGSEFRERALPPSLELVLASPALAPAPGVRASVGAALLAWRSRLVVDLRFRALAAANMLAFTKFFFLAPVAPPALRVAVLVCWRPWAWLGEGLGGFWSAATAGDLTRSSGPPFPAFSVVFFVPSVLSPPPRKILLMKPFFSLAPVAPSARG